MVIAGVVDDIKRVEAVMKKSLIVILLCLFNAMAFGQNAADFNATLKSAQQGEC